MLAKIRAHRLQSSQVPTPAMLPECSRTPQSGPPLFVRFSPPPRRRLYSTLIRTQPAKLAGNQEYNVKQAGELSKQAHTRARATQAALAHSTPFGEPDAGQR